METKMRPSGFITIMIFLILFSSGDIIFARSKKQLAKEAEALKALQTAKIDVPEEATENANIIRQPFIWESAGDVLKYEIIITRKNEKTGLWEEYYSHETDEEESENCLVYIEPTLPPGVYRSQIKVYNILGVLEEDLGSSDEFTVRRAFKPEIKSLSYPLYMSSTIYLDDIDNNGIIEIEGRNLFMPPESEESLQATNYVLKSIKKTVNPEKILEHDDNNRKVKFLFNMKEIDVGKYHLVAKDLSGLHSENNSSSELIVKFKKWLDIDIEAGWTMPVVLHDSTISDYLETKLFPLSGQAKISVIPFKHNFGYLGFGIRGNYSWFKNEKSGYSIDGNIMTAHLIFIDQIPLGKKRHFFWEFHGGAGLTYFHNIKFHFPHDIESEQLNTVSLSFDGGSSFMWFPNKRLYVEAGADYIYTQNSDMNMGEILPVLGIGWQF